MKNKDLFKAALAAPLLALTLAAAPFCPATAQTFKEPKEASFSYVEQMPVFKGGETEMLRFLASNIKYPQEARENGLEGLVVVQFIVETDGTLSEVMPVKKLGRGTEEEAVRVIKLMSGNWTAGRQNDKPVRVKYVLPVRFALPEAERAATAAIANRMPQFKGGQEAMVQTLKPYLALPAEAKQENLNARVIMKFYVGTDGSVSNIRLEGTKLKKTVGPDSNLDYMDASTFQLQNKTILAKLSEAAMAAVKATSGKWEPATKNGQPAAAEVMLPVQFMKSEDISKEQALQLPAPTMTKYTKASYAFGEADTKPTFTEGPLEKFLAKNLRYPASPNFEGVFKTRLVIKEDGKIIGPLMFPNKDVSTEDQLIIHDEIRRVVKLMEGKWTPGKVDGQAVPVTKDLTIKFVTNDGTKKPADKGAEQADVIVTRFK